MLLSSLFSLYETRVFPLESTDVLFNPYRDRHAEFDCKDAARIRRENLRSYLAAFRKRPQVLIIGEAFGPWGARFTGVPYTSEQLFAEGSLPFSGQKSSRQPQPYAERSATIFWKVMAAHFPRFVVWNSLPLQPHRPGEPLSIRPPTSREIAEHLDILAHVMETTKPKRVIAVGRKAESALTRLNEKFIYVRHPSHGGATEFAEGMGRVFD